MSRSAVDRLGFRSGVIAGMASIAFSVTALMHMAGLLDTPWNPDIPDGASFVLALSFVVLLACIYERAPVPLRIWGLVGLALAILYAAMVTQVYMTIITVVTPSEQAGKAAGPLIAPFAFDEHGSYLQAIDGLGYFLMSLATWFAAPVFAGESQRWARRLFEANGVVGIAVLLAYMPLLIPEPAYTAIKLLTLPWIVTLPVAAFLAARDFRRQPSSAASTIPQSDAVAAPSTN